MMARPLSRRHSKNVFARRGVFANLLLVFALLAGMVQSLFVNVPTASAHNLDASAVYIFFDANTQSVLDNRINGGWTPGDPILQTGDELGMVIKAVPDNGTTTGVGGYTTYYIPNGVQVIDAAFLAPGSDASDGITGYDRIGAKGQALIANVGAAAAPPWPCPAFRVAPTSPE